MTDYAPAPRHRCPSCGSRAPHLHPAVQFEGEVETCADDYHLIPTNQNSASYIAAVHDKRDRLVTKGAGHE